MWLAAMLAGLALVAAGGVFLIVAYDGSRHGWASFRHAAPIPIVAIAVGLALIAVGVWRFARGRSRIPRR